MIFVYAISSLNHNYIYVGQTDHVIRRLHAHNNGLEKTTRPYAPYKLIFSSECEDRVSARYFIKYFKSSAGKRMLKAKRNEIHPTQTYSIKKTTIH